MRPIVLYKQKLENNVWEYNPEQEKILYKLDEYYSHLQHSNIWQSLFYRNFKKGLYLWGSVGSGKTSLINIMIECCRGIKTRRYHFHEFMENIKNLIQIEQGKKNPVDIVLRKLSKEVRIIFIDEFCINDIGYAILLKNILISAIKHNIFIITTANRPPEEIYTGIINKDLFNPAIELIQSNFLVMNLDSDIDYRSLNNQHNQNYFHPITPMSDKIMIDMFEYLSQGVELPIKNIEINNRNIHILKLSENVIWLNFDNLCNVPRCKADYLVICKKYKNILINEINPLGNSKKDLIVNFCHFIDIAYEGNNRVVFSANCGIEKIFKPEVTIPAIKRTISRIKQMQYLTL